MYLTEDEPQLYSFSLPPLQSFVNVDTSDPDITLNATLCHGGIQGQSLVRGRGTQDFTLEIDAFFPQRDIETLAEAAQYLPIEDARQVLCAIQAFPRAVATPEGISYILPNVYDDGPDTHLLTIRPDCSIHCNRDVFPKLQLGGTPRYDPTNRLQYWFYRQGSSYALGLRFGAITPNNHGNPDSPYRYNLVADLRFRFESARDLNTAVAEANHPNGFAFPDQRRIRGIVNNIGRITSNRLPDVAQ